MTFYGNIEITDGASGLNTNAESKIVYLAGTYNFDVSSYVDTSLYDVTNDGTTWTVTAK